ncbi:MAG TPA: FecR domain-containing protein [Puia sp.]|nr:FecR domain-containing protein [Puia sp.]
MPDARLAHLFQLYIAKTASSGEKEELIGLMADIQHEEQVKELIGEAWEGFRPGKGVFAPAHSEVILERIWMAAAGPAGAEMPETGTVKTKAAKIREITPGRSNKGWWRAAAVLLFMAGTGTWLYVNHRSQQETTKTANAHRQFDKDIPPGGDKAILTLADGSTLALDSAQNGMITRQGNTKILKSGKGQLAYSVNPSADQPVSYNTLSIPRGGQYQLVLPDGSKVWLNAASSLRFPTAFRGKERKVELTGEAYFEVTKNTSMPFKVSIVSSSTVRQGSSVDRQDAGGEKMEIEVLGTGFNVMAYEDEKNIRTTLLEGAIKLILSSGRSPSGGRVPTPSRGGGEDRRLKPGQQAQLDKQGRMEVIDRADTELAVAWKNGRFQFDDAGIRTIMNQVSRWYDVDIEYNGNVPDKLFTGKISRNVNVSQVLGMLEYAGLHFQIEGKKIIVLP